MNDVERVILPELFEMLTETPAVGLLGPRQVGKSTCARQLLEKYPNALLLDLQDRRTIAQLSEPEALFAASRDRLVILDEIQRAPELLSVLRPEIDAQRTPGRFFLLGSASPHLIRNASESLAGRIFYAELTPLSLFEALAGGKSLNDHFVYGGYPEPLLHSTQKARKRWYLNYVQTFITRDLAELGISPNIVEFERLLIMLAHIHGGAFNASELARSLRISASTVQRYVDILEGAFLIRILRPYLPNVGKRLSKQPRIYWRDNGLRNALLGLFTYEDLLLHPSLGAAWEGYAIEEICRAMGQFARPSFYRTSHGAELDLVMELEGGRKVAFEIKFSTGPRLSKGFYNAVEDVKPNQTFIITPDSESYIPKEGVRVCDLKTYLETLKE